MEKKRDAEVLKIEKSERVKFLDNFNQTIFPRLNRSIASLKEVPLDYYCKKNNLKSAELFDDIVLDTGESEGKKEDVGKNNDTKLIIEKEGANVKKEKGVENVRMANQNANNKPVRSVKKTDIRKGMPVERTGRNPQTGKEIHNSECSNGVDNDCDGGVEVEVKAQARDRMSAQARERMSAQVRIRGELEGKNMALREGSEDPIPGIDVIVDKDPSAIPVHFDGNDCLDCGEEPVKLSDKTAEILMKALLKIQNQGWKLELKKVDITKYPKGKHPEFIPVKKVEKKSLFGLFDVDVEVEAKINIQGEITDIDEP